MYFQSIFVHVNMSLSFVKKQKVILPTVLACEVNGNN